MWCSGALSPFVLEAVSSELQTCPVDPFDRLNLIRRQTGACGFASGIGEESAAKSLVYVESRNESFKLRTHVEASVALCQREGPRAHDRAHRAAA